MLELAGGIITKDSKILLIHRNTKNLIQWEVPGGKIENLETPEMAVVREFKEELDIDIIVGEKILIANFTENAIDFKYHVFEVLDYVGQLKINETFYFDKYRFFSIAALKDKENEISPIVVKLLNHLTNE
jgi:mutator protein MutT